jgi:hypothetical protein
MLWCPTTRAPRPSWRPVNALTSAVHTEDRAPARSGPDADLKKLSLKKRTVAPSPSRASNGTTSSSSPRSGGFEPPTFGRVDGHRLANLLILPNCRGHRNGRECPRSTSSAERRSASRSSVALQPPAAIARGAQNARDMRRRPRVLDGVRPQWPTSIDARPRPASAGQLWSSGRQPASSDIVPLGRRTKRCLTGLTPT